MHDESSILSASSIPIPPWDPSWSGTPVDSEMLEAIGRLRFDVIVDAARGAAENLAMDTALLYAVAEGRREAAFRLWEWKETAVVLGSYQSVSAEVDAGEAGRLGAAVVRRMSGGGAMFVEPARTITWSLVLPEAVVAGRSFVHSFAALDAWAVRALRARGIAAGYRPINDITLPAGKLAGAAQCRRRRTVLHHVTMAWELDNDLMFRLLRLHAPRTHPTAVPSAVKRVAPLADVYPGSREDARSHLVDAFTRMHRCSMSRHDAVEETQAGELLHAKFLTEEWTRRVP